MNRKIYKSSSIFTAESDVPISGVIVTDNDVIEYVGPEDGICDMYEDAEIEDLGDKTIVPGLIDCHVHSFNVARMQQCKAHFLSLDFTYDELIADMRKFIAETPDPVNGIYYFFDYNFETSGRITKYDLDRIFGRDTAISLVHYSLHSGTFSTKALEIIGYDFSENLPEGSDVIYEEDGSIGYWGEESFFELNIKSMMLGDSSSEDSAIDEIQDLFNSNGYTAISEMRPLGNIQEYIWPEERYLEREKEGSLTLRIGVCSSLAGEPESWNADRERMNGDYIFFSSLKGFMDGGYMNSTAWTSAEYITGPNKGKHPGPTSNMDFYARKIKEANDIGIGVRLHAEGDLAVEKSLELYELSDNKNVMNGIEHCTTMTDKTLEKIKKHVEDGRKISLNFQPAFLYNEAPSDTYHLSCGDEFYNKTVKRVKSAFKTGANVSVGSTDYPVVQPIAKDHIRIEVNRLSDVEGSLYYGKGYTMDEAITLAEAITGTTKNAAAAIGRGNDLGILKKGYKADMTIFDCDIFALDPARYIDMNIYETIVNGREVYRNKGRK